MTPSSLRTDVLTGRQVIVAPERGSRPGACSSEPTLTNPESGDPFLEGREFETPHETLALRRDDTSPDQTGWLIRVVPNQFPAVRPNNFQEPPLNFSTGREVVDSVLHRRIFASGHHEVVVENPRSESCFADLSVAEAVRIVLAWQRRVRELETLDGILSVTVFKNEGFSAGASLPHAHSQILALHTLPPEMQTRELRMDEYRTATGHRLLQDLCEEEFRKQERVIDLADDSVLLCPFAGRMGWQMRCIPQHSETSFSKTSESVLVQMASQLWAGARSLRHCAGPLALNLTLVQPMHSRNAADWFLELLPRPARLAGFELATDVDIVTIAPEAAAERLRNQLQVEVPSAADIVPNGYSWTA